ncbi:MAG: type II toxin-antitoxin system PemK/MazF family toxin [Mycoplasmoidaceae bacterium]
MNQKPFKNKRWKIFWISEEKYNYYKDVDKNKKRPVMIWSNARKLKGWNICLFLSTKKPPINKCHFAIKTKISNNNQDTWIYLDKILFVYYKDLGQRGGHINDSQAKESIRKLIEDFWLG